MDNCKNSLNEQKSFAEFVKQLSVVKNDEKIF
jgi:hypothetical protein